MGIQKYRDRHYINALLKIKPYNNKVKKGNQIKITPIKK